MAIIEALVTLVIKKNQTENKETTVFADIDPVGRDEFAAAGQRGFKATYKAEVWGFEYNNEPEIVINGQKYTIYRTYGPKASGKIELYAAERVGRN